MNEIAGFQIKSRTDFLSISPEQMEEMLADADIKQLLTDIGEGGYGAKMVATLEDFAEQAGKIEELEAQMYESLMQISFDSMYDSFIDTLMDMNASAEDFADDFSEYMMKALLANKVGEMMYDDLESWYKRFGESMKDGQLSDDEMASLREDWDKLVSEGLAMRDDLAAATGYTGESEGTTQSGKPGSFNAMSQEQGTKLEGLFTSGQMHWASMDEQMQDVSEQMGTAVDHLRRIEENTGNSARHLDEIKNDIKKIIRDGLKMK